MTKLVTKKYAFRDLKRTALQCECGGEMRYHAGGYQKHGFWHRCENCGASEYRDRMYPVWEGGC